MTPPPQPKQLPSRFPSPPKPSFDVELVPPSSGFGGQSFGGGGGNGGQAYGNFSGQFLKLMQEAGEKLGKAAAVEIEKVNFSFKFGDRPPGEGVTGKQSKTPGENFAVNQFMKAAGLGRNAAGMKAFAAGGLVGGLGSVAKFITDTPNRAGELAESQRHFARVSPEMAGVFARSDVRGMQRDLVSGQNIAPSAQRMIRELDKFRDSMAQVGDGVTELKNVVEGAILTAINSLVGPVIESVAGKRKTGEGLPFVTKIQELAQEERRGANAWRAPELHLPPHHLIDWQNGKMRYVPDPNFIGPLQPVAQPILEPRPLGGVPLPCVPCKRAT